MWLHLRLSLAGLLLVLALGACERPGASGSTSKPETADAPAEDSNGPARIVSLAPSVTETLFALDAGDRIVGVTRFCDYPKEATTLPQVGGLTDVDVEMVLSLRPDLVVGVSSETSRGLRQTLDAADIETLFLPVETFDDVQRSIEKLGEVVGAEEAARELSGAIGAHEVKAGPDAPRVLVLFGRDPWIGAGPGTFADEMIRRAGGRNALAHLDAEYPTLDTERVSSLELDLVVDTSWGEGRVELPRDDIQLARVEPALMRPGPRLSMAMEFFERAIGEATTP